MKRKYCAALVLSCSFFLLTGFDSKLSTQDIIESMIAADNDHSSVSTKADMTMQMDMSISSEDSSVPPLSASVLVNYGYNLDILKDSSMKMESEYTILIPGDSMSSSSTFYRVPNLSGDFKNYIYSDIDGSWKKSTFPSFVESYIQHAMSRVSSFEMPDFNSLLDSIVEWANSEDIPISEEEYAQLQESFTLLDDIYKDFYADLSNLFTVSPNPVEVNGVSCYELKGTISMDDIGLSKFFDLLIEDIYQENLNDDSLTDLFIEEESQEILEENEAICTFFSSLFENISMDITYYIDDSTFECVQAIFDYSNWDLNSFIDFIMDELINENASMYGSSEETFSIPDLDITVPVYSITINYSYDQVGKIYLPADAIGAQEIPFEDAMGLGY